MTNLNHGYTLRGNQISKARPYDDASYYYAIATADADVWSICKDGKLIFPMHCTSLNKIADLLQIKNSRIKSKIVHN